MAGMGGHATPGDTPGDTPEEPPEEPPVPYVCVYASQVAACIGANRHSSVSDATVAMWTRISPSGFREAMRRNGLKTEEDMVRDIAEAHADVRTLVERSLGAASVTSEGVSASYEGVSEELGAVTLDDREKQMVDAALKKNLYTSYGTRAEPETLQYVREVMRVPCHADPTFYKVRMGEAEGVPWFVGGKIDALSDDGSLVIEIKNRVNRLFHRAPAYEAVQVQTYLEVVDVPHGILVECFTPDAGPVQTSVIPIARDRVKWRQDIAPKLRTFVGFLVRLLRDEALQDAFLRSKRPSAMVVAG